MARDRLLFFATDMHGSEACFRKFLSAGRVYGADTLIMGGDITGKVIVPVHPAPHGHVARWRDTDHELATAAELDAFVRAVADAGGYAWRVERDEAAATFADDAATDALFTRLVAERVRAWVRLADERLGDGVQAFAIPGNDDVDEVDDALAGGARLRLAEGTVTWLDDWLPMISYGDSTPTPWNSPREVTEEAYAARLDELIGMLHRPGEGIFNLHVPPYGTPLDLAPSLDADLRVRYTAAGDMLMAPVGSHAVRAALERAQPVASLHGHVHESRGRARLGRTVCFNPGSDYPSGVLRGVLVKVSRKRGVADYTFTTG
jgi:Icc-related predicted phosphoesterase